MVAGVPPAVRSASSFADPLVSPRCNIAGLHYSEFEQYLSFAFRYVTDEC